MSALRDKTNDELADGICTWAGRLAAGEAELLEWIAEYDRREAWVGVGLLSCAHWLSWRIGLSPGAAREKVRVARALPELAVVREAYAAGRLSYSQVRAISRAATADDQERWVELARSSTAGQLERLVRGVRRVRAVEEAEADPEATSWRRRARKSWDADGNAVYTIVLPAEQAAVLDIAIETVRQQLDAETKAEEVKGVPAETSPPPPVEAPPRPTEGDLDLGPIISRGATVADAVLHMARTVLGAQAQAHPDAARRARIGLKVQVDPLSGWARLRDGEVLPPCSLHAVLRSLPGRQGHESPVLGRLRPLGPADLRRHDQGRDSRVPSASLREMVATLDGHRCRFPGCTRHRKLHAHHVVYWSAGGRTDLSNLLLLCSRHHTLVHAQGFQLRLKGDRSLEVATADDVRVLHHPTLPWQRAAELDPGHDVSAETLPPDRIQPRVDLGYAIMVLSQQAA